MTYEIQFSDPVNASGYTPSSTEPFAFSRALVVATSTDTSSPAFAFGFSYGEIFTGTLVLFLFLVVVWDILIRHSIGNKIKRRLVK